jgi:uncharacterized repeat protein (TIGR01451 family)
LTNQRAILLALTTVVLLGLHLAHPPTAVAAPGDVDLEVTVSGTYSPGLLGLGPSIDWTVRVTNSTADSAISTTATQVTVQDVMSAFSPSTPGRSSVSVSTGSYGSSTGTWSVGSLAPGATATLQFENSFPLLSSGAGTLSAQVNAQVQSDLDSQPSENSDIGDQDDEAVWRTSSGTLRRVGDKVWNDLNSDGRFATGEPGVRGVQVIVTSSSDGRIFAGRTDGTGIWSYTAVSSGSVVMTRFIAPTGYVFTASKVGDDAGDSDADPITGSTAQRTISSDDLLIDAGLRLTADISVTKSVTPGLGIVPLVATYTVTAANAGPGAASGLAITDSLPAGGELVSGSVSVSQGSAVPGVSSLVWTPGQIGSGISATMSYQLRFTSAGTFENRAQVTAAGSPDPDSSPGAESVACSSQSGQDDCASVGVSVTPTGSLSGTVWRDLNGDGQRTPEEPVEAGVTVRRRTTAGVLEASATTGPDGSWLFAGVPVGDYEVEVVPTEGAAFTLRDVPPDGTDSDFPSSGRLDVVVSAAATTTVGAGLVRADAPSTDSPLTPQGTPVSFNVLDNDGIPGRSAGSELPQGWTWNRIEGPEWGSVTCESNGLCTYVSLGAFAGIDTFGYTVTNPSFGTTSGEVQVEVLHVNDPPVARNDRAVAQAGEAVTIEVTANDEDPNDPTVVGDPNRPGDPPTISGTGPLSPAGSGSISCSGQSCTFTPAAGFTGKAALTYTITDSGLSDPRVENDGVPGGLPALSPASSSAVVEVWVDPARRPSVGFTSLVSSPVNVGAGGLSGAASATATGSCSGGRPQVVVAWSSVAKATGYRIERRPEGSGASWREAAVVGSGATLFTDHLVGEAQSVSYRVIPLRRRLSGEPSATSTAALPAPAGPVGC